MQKKSFFNRQTTAITALFHGSTMDELVARARAAEFQGADGIAVLLKNLPPEERTVDHFKRLMQEVRLPFMFIDYRDDQWFGKDDAARQEYLLKAAEAGAEVIDVMGDLFAPAPNELTSDVAAISKQKALIDEIHARGARAIVSSHQHTLPATTAEEVLAIMQEQRARGADICKLVASVNTETELLEAIRATMLLNSRLDVPFVYLSNGAFSRPHRFLGMQLGVAITFAVTGYEAEQLGAQPTIEAFRAIRDHFHWDIKDL